jgi:hypothetical protein
MGQHPTRKSHTRGLVKGYAIAKNEYVLLDAEDVQKVKLESTRIIDINPPYNIEKVDDLRYRHGGRRLHRGRAERDAEGERTPGERQGPAANLG